MKNKTKAFKELPKNGFKLGYLFPTYNKFAAKTKICQGAIGD